MGQNVRRGKPASVTYWAAPPPKVELDPRDFRAELGDANKNTGWRIHEVTL